MRVLTRPPLFIWPPSFSLSPLRSRLSLSLPLPRHRLLSFSLKVSRPMPVSVSANVAVPTPAPSPPYPQARPLSADCNDDDSAHWDTVLAHGSIPAYHVYSQPIHKSDQDDRAYRVIKLQNGLQAVLVHDANTDKAAASLNVAVGHLSDPVSRFLYTSP